MNNKSQKLNLLTYIFRKIKRKINSLRFYLQALISNKKIIYLNKHENYSDYLNHQKDKTTNPEKIKIWLGKEWDIKYFFN